MTVLFLSVESWACDPVARRVNNTIGITESMVVDLETIRSEFVSAVNWSFI